MTGLDALVVLTALAYLAMFVVFAYVDMAWDAASMVTVAIAMADVRSVLAPARQLRTDHGPPLGGGCRSRHPRMSPLQRRRLAQSRRSSSNDKIAPITRNPPSWRRRCHERSAAARTS